MNQSTMFLGLITGAAILGLPGAVTVPQANYQLTPISAPAATESQSNYADAPQITAKAGFCLESNSGEILFAHHADDRLPVASMTKIATLGVIYRALDAGQIHMDDQIMVSERAASMGGSQAFLDYGSEYPVRDLIQSIVVASANDSCVAMAEALAGSVENFVTRMNEFARDAGATNTNFVNCTGLPVPGAYSTARDMALMYRAIMQSPHYGDFNQIWMYNLTHPSGRVTGLTNTNKLIRSYPNCLGGKTGFTNEAGHCITVAAANQDVKPIAVIIGAGDSQTRFRESSALLNYACQNFVNQRLVDRTQPFRTVQVKNANTEQCALYPTQDYYHLTHKNQPHELTIAADIPDVVTAPLNPDTPVGKVVIMDAGKVVAEIPVVPAEPVPAASYFDNVRKIVNRTKL